MNTPQMIASRLVDGPNPADRTLPLIDTDAADGRDFLTVSRRAYRGLVEAAVREALAERDTEADTLRAQVTGLANRVAKQSELLSKRAEKTAAE